MVAIQHEETKEWSKRGRIVDNVALRSYTVKLQNGRTIRRNTRTLKKLHVVASNFFKVSNPPIVEPNVSYPLNPAQQENFESDSEGTTVPYMESDSETTTIPYMDSDEHELSSENSIQKTTRSGRVVKIKRPLDYEEI